MTRTLAPALLLSSALLALPSAFEHTTRPDYPYAARGPAFQTWFAPSRIDFTQHGDLVSLRLHGARPVHPVAEEPLAGVAHYLIGQKHRYGQTLYQRIRYRNVYPGIDLVFYFRPQLEFDFEVAPGADPSRIALRFSGPRHVALDHGDLLLTTAHGQLRHHAPEVYQNGHLLPSRFVTSGDGLVRFAYEGHQPGAALRIDPRVSYQSYLGGSLIDAAFGFAADSAGNSYVCGWTDSLDFPIPPTAPVSRYNTNRDAYLAKFSPSGALLLAAYIGGNQGDACSGVTLDPAGNIYLVGNMFSTNFPRTAGTSEDGLLRGWIMKLSPEGRMIYSYILGTVRTANASRIGLFTPVVDATGALHVAGGTPGFTGINSQIRTSFGGGITDGFYLRLNPAGDAVTYYTLIGGLADDEINGMALDRDGTVYVVGNTRSANILAPPDVTPRVPSAGTAFAMKINPRTNEVLWLTTFGNPNSTGFGLALTPQGLWVAGSTPDGLPVTSTAFQSTYGGGTSDGFLARLSPGDGQIQYASYHGGSGEDAFADLTTQPNGNIFAAGRTASTNLPLTADATQATYGGGAFDGFITHVNAAGQRTFSTYAGGSGNDHVQRIAIDRGQTLVTGTTDSPNLAVTTDGAQTRFGGGGSDAFLLRIDPAGAPETSALPSFTAAGVVSAATFEAGAIAPGQIVTIFATNAGPAELVTAQLTPDRRIATLAGATRVFFDGLAAPIVYTVAGQVSCVAPYAIAGRATTQIQVEYQGRRSPAVTVPVVATVPGIFTTQNGTGLAAALNGTVCCNSAATPASPGSIVTIFLTGEGQTTPAGVDGRLAEFARLEDFPRPLLPVTVRIGGRDAAIAYAGAAPGLLAGLMQINFTIPTDAPTGLVPVVVRIGDRESRAGVTIAVGR